jgi:hypothetical protein
LNKHREKASMAITLKILPGLYAIAKLPPQAPVPAWLAGVGLWAVVGADDETTIICPQERMPKDITSTRNWACLRTTGPFGFDETGIVSNLITPLSEAGIGIFVLCTYDGEHVMLPASDLPRGKELLSQAGYLFDE